MMQTSPTKRPLTAVLVAAIVLGCRLDGCASPLNASLAGTHRYLCCSVHFNPPTESTVFIHSKYNEPPIHGAPRPADLSDANYQDGTAMLPPGTALTIDLVRRRGVAFSMPGYRFTLNQEFGVNEPFESYLNKVLLADDPTPAIASYPMAIQQAIHDSRVEVGMTKEQVLRAIGYPPTHETPSVAANDWTYWESRFRTFHVYFGSDGKVVSLNGGRTLNQPIEAASPSLVP